MSPELSSGPPNPADGHPAPSDPNRSEMATTPANTARQSQATSDVRTSHTEPVAIEGRHRRKRHRFASATRRRLGPVEYTLLALIALSIAITIVMAIANP